MNKKYYWFVYETKLKITFEFVIFINASKCIIINFINNWIFCQYLKKSFKFFFMNFIINLFVNKWRNIVYDFILIINNRLTKMTKYIFVIKKIDVVELTNVFFWRNNFALWHIRWHCQRSKFYVYQCFLIFFMFSRKNTQTFQYRFSFSNKWNYETSKSNFETLF